MHKALFCIAVLLLPGCSSSGGSGTAGQPRPKETPRAAAAQLNLRGASAAGPASGGTGGGGTVAGPGGAAPVPGAPLTPAPGNQTASNGQSNAQKGPAIRPGLARMPGYQASLTVVDPGQSGNDSLARGYQLYRENCSVCHGPDLRGPDNTTTMPMRDLTLFKQYKYGSTDQALYRTLVYGIPRTAMGNFSTSFTPAQTWDILHYLKSKRRD